MSSNDVIGRVEIAKLLGVETRTPHAWSARGRLPEPDFESVNAGPAWKRSSIIKWAVETGRLPEYLAEEGAEYGPVAAVRGGRRQK